MNYLNVQTVLNKVFTMFNTSTALRTKAVTWFSEVARDVLNQPRDWQFLEETVDIAIVSGTVTLPSGASEIVYLIVGDQMLNRANQLTDGEAFDYSGDLIGYTLDGSVVTLVGDTDATTVTLKYEVGLSTDYTDVATDTIFPLDFENLFITGVRAKYYDFEKDGRYTKEEMKHAGEMSKMKAWDNRRKPKPSFTSGGYLRT